MSDKTAIIPFAGEIHVALPDDFEGSADDALDWWFENMPADFTLDKWIHHNGGMWDFYRHIHQGGGVWCAETACDVSVEDDQ